MWQLSVNGDTIQRGFFELDLPAGQSVIDSIPFRMPTIEAVRNVLLTVSFLLKDKTKWADAGHEIAWDEMVVETPVFAEEKIVLKGKISVSENENEIHVSGDNFKYSISKKTGELSSCAI
jgi:beta-galactosidase